MGNVQNPATEDFDLSGYRARNAAVSERDSDYIRRDELSDVIIAALAVGRFLLRNGQNVPTADIPFDNHTITGIRDAVSAHEPLAKGQFDAYSSALTNSTNSAIDAINARWHNYVPRNRQVFNPINASTTMAWPTVGGKPVDFVYACLIGGKGGNATWAYMSSGATYKGGLGGRALICLPYDAAIGTIGISVGSSAPNVSGPDPFETIAAGGGGATKLTFGARQVIAGGGGGGGGYASPWGFNNPAGGAAGIAGQPSPHGGSAGWGGSEFGGTGGAAEHDGNPGTSNETSEPLDFLFPDGANDGTPRIILAW